MHLYAAGSNGSGQLGIGHQDDVSTFTPAQFHPSVQHLLPNSSILDLVSSSTHALLLLRTSTEPGDVSRNILLGAGTNTLGQLGPKCALWEGVRPEPIWKAVDFLGGLGKGGHEEWEAVKIGVTWTTSFVVYRRISLAAGGAAPGGEDEVEEEMVVACGSNDFGELGHEAEAESEGIDGSPSDFPTIVNLSLGKGEKVELLRGGQRHVVVLISGPDGQRVMGWGASRKGELDISTIGSSSHTGIAPAPGNGKTEDGRFKGKGKTAVKSPIRPFLPPTPLPLSLPPHSRIIDIRLGASHTLALLSTGSILAWGSNAKGQITNLSSITNAVDIVTTWGGSYILCLSPSGPELLSQGANTHSQLLRNIEREGNGVDLPNGSVEKVIAGSEHLLVLLNPTAEEVGQGELWAGGWNEHGNLGLGDKEDRGTLTRVDLGSIEGKAVKGVWAGCGSSWVWLE